MKLRFLAIAGIPEKLDRLALAIDRSGPDLQPVLQRPSLRVWASAETPRIEIAGGAGLLLGLLFRKTDGGRTVALDAGASLEERIVRDHWGPYILLRQTEDGHLISRDPSGALTAYHGTVDGLHVYASDAALLQLAWPRPLTPSIKFLKQFLAYPFLRATLTGGDGIAELLPGQRRTVSGTTATLDLCWSPFDYLPEPGASVPYEEASERLRRVILNTMPRFAIAGEAVALQLSGGLDSSILAAALAEAGRPFRAITFATRTADGDERRYARLVADHFGVELTELVEPAWTPDFESFEANPLRPPPNPMMQPFHRSIAIHVAAAGTDILIDGGGGDNVLGRLSTASPVLDAFRHAGAGTAWKVSGDLARLHGCTRWTVLRAALRRAKRRHAPHWSPDLRFLAAGAPWERPQPHPWLVGAPGLTPGKADQLNMIVGIRHFLADPSPGMPASFHPLLAQPLLEACLAMPTWFAMRDGRERAVARHAFRGLVPEAILDRRSKGRFESIFLRGFMNGRERLEGLLLDGRLRAAGLLDANAVSACLRRPGEPTDHDYLRLLEIVPAEQWLRSFGS